MSIYAKNVCGDVPREAARGVCQCHLALGEGRVLVDPFGAEPITERIRMLLMEGNAYSRRR
jgi:hypothetical protein